MRGRRRVILKSVLEDFRSRKAVPDDSRRSFMVLDQFFPGRLVLGPVVGADAEKYHLTLFKLLMAKRIDKKNILPAR
jgi:hypothetical protein